MVTFGQRQAESVRPGWQTCRVNLSIRALRAESRVRLTRAGLASPSAEADALLAEVLGGGRDEVELAVLFGRELDEPAVRRLHELLARRERREPLQLLLGRAPFDGLDLAVGPGVFIPRPETEILVELAAQELGPRAVAVRRALRIADLGSGSGAIALALARRLPAAELWAVEASPHAWPWLRANTARYGAGRVHPVFDRIGPRALPPAALPLDAVLSNPPYIPAANQPADPEVRRHDPPAALYGGPDGLEPIRGIVALAAQALTPRGLLLLEHDDHHGAPVRELLQRGGFTAVRTWPDLAGRERITGGYS